MPESASRAVVEAEILENAETVMLSAIRIHQSESHQGTQPDDGFGIDLVSHP